MDPDTQEEQGASAVVQLAFSHHHELTNPAQPKLVMTEGALACHCTGTLTSDQLLDLFEVGKAGCEQVAEFARASLVQALS